jgi:leucyl aminopeptidase
MLEQRLDCLVESADEARPLHVVRPAGLAAFLDRLPPAQSRFLRQLNFTGGAQELFFLPGEHGVAGAVVGIGEDMSPAAFGDLAFRLPQATVWRLQAGQYDIATAVLGFCLGAYRYRQFKAPKREPARLVVASKDQQPSRRAASATWMVRDLINTPANLLGPRELAEFTETLGKRYGAATTVISGDTLAEAYPAVAAVGRGSARAPQVAIFRWSGSGAHADAPLISLCGKGVCFDTGGYDIKPSSGMLRMKKDMGGAATILGLARMIMEADLPVRLAVRIGCVENSISGAAMRPSDVIRTRKGVAVEVGNTDAEGRLVLCDLITDACDECPRFLADCATLTGAARVALGPDLPALFCNDDEWAEALSRHGREQNDPLWRLPLWAPYDRWLDSPVGDFNNIASKPYAGAVVAGLFLNRFVPQNIPWAHLDLYAWNDQSSPGRPEGGEAYGMRALFAALAARFGGEA